MYGSTDPTCVDNGLVSPISLWWAALPFALGGFSELFINVPGKPKRSPDARLQESMLTCDTAYGIAYSRAPVNMRGLVSAINLLNTGFAYVINLALSPVITDPHLVWDFGGPAIVGGFVTVLFVSSPCVTIDIASSADFPCSTSYSATLTRRNTFSLLPRLRRTMSLLSSRPSRARTLMGLSLQVLRSTRSEKNSCRHNLPGLHDTDLLVRCTMQSMSKIEAQMCDERYTSLGIITGLLLGSDMSGSQRVPGPFIASSFFHQAQSHFRLPQFLGVYLRLPISSRVRIV